MQIITISGQAQHGKDTTAEILKKKLEKLQYKVLIIHYADYLKYICSQYYGWDGKKDVKGRALLQQVGTEKARSKCPDFWVSIVEKFISVFGDDFDYILIPDCRFPNEVQYLKDRNYDVMAVKVNRIKFENSLTKEQRNHPSETALNDFQFDKILAYESGVEFVEMAVNEFIKKEIVNE
ncbi:MAG: hypothetical protein GX947_03085 [Tissierellia bacterium]|nr:hypothetical protein [Tissierellia bacterium]